jgi:hypothetical protein
MDYIPHVTEADVVRVVARDFPSRDRDAVFRLLRQCAQEIGPAAGPRTQLAILKLSDGKLEHVPMHAEVAARDYRDVLAAAEYPEWLKVGFTGTDSMPAEEVENLKRRDWEQYAAWLTR